MCKAMGPSPAHALLDPSALQKAPVVTTRTPITSSAMLLFPGSP